MYYLCPKVKLVDQNTLFVIGNGFDLASGIKSSYNNFKDWLIFNKRHRLINSMDTFFSNEQEVWADIEKALGEYDYDSILDVCNCIEEIDYDHPTRSIDAIEGGPDWILKPVLEELIKAFTDWVDSIDITVGKKVLFLPSRSKFLTFNYTETLEKIYGISQSNILHIHGSRLSKKNYIIGHDNLIDKEEVYSDEGQYFCVQNAKSKIIELMNGLVKDCQYIINLNQDFFDALSNIQQVIVLGHSLYKIDWPYMNEIVTQIGQNKPWTISYHTANDFINIDSFKKAYGLANVTTFLW